MEEHVRSVMQCAKPLGRASVRESVTGISWGDEIERRGTWGHCTNNGIYVFGFVPAHRACSVSLLNPLYSVLVRTTCSFIVVWAHAILIIPTQPLNPHLWPTEWYLLKTTLLLEELVGILFYSMLWCMKSLIVFIRFW